MQAVLLGVVSVTGPVAAAGPRDPRERITTSGQTLARRALLRRSDLVAAWRPVRAPAGGGANDRCPRFSPDLSAFTLTGDAQSYFTNGLGSAIMSDVHVYASRRDARGVFREGVRPGLLRCLTQGWRDEANRDPRTEFGVSSSKMISTRLAGSERAADYRVRAWIKAGSRRLPIYVGVLMFQRGRSIGMIFVSALGQPLQDRAQLAELVARRMR